LAARQKTQRRISSRTVRAALLKGRIGMSVNGNEAEMPKYLGDVRCWVNSGRHLLALSFSGFDPGCVKTRRRI
jgi:hypothetical protein